MIEVLRTKNEYVYAFIEWLTVDKDGVPRDNEDRVHVYDLWIHPRRPDGDKVIARFRERIKQKVPNCKDITWEREKDGRLRHFQASRFKNRRYKSNGK